MVPNQPLISSTSLTCTTDSVKLFQCIVLSMERMNKDKHSHVLQLDGIVVSGLL